MVQEHALHGEADARAAAFTARRVPSALAAVYLSVLDVVSTVAAFAICGPLYALAWRFSVFDVWSTLILGLACGVSIVAILASGRTYSLMTAQLTVNNLLGFIRAWVVTFVAMLTLAFVTKTTSSLSRGELLTTFALGLPIALLLRSAGLAYLQRAVGRGLILVKSVYLVHVGSQERYAATVRSLAMTGVHVAGGWIGGGQAEAQTAGQGSRQAALTPAQVSEAAVACRDLMRREHCDAVYFYPSGHDLGELTLLQQGFRLVPLPVLFVPDEQTVALLGHTVSRVGDAHAFEVQRPPLSPLERTAKRTIDILGALTGLILLSPLLAAVASALLFVDGRPIIFRQLRSGFGGRLFPILKFRTMTVQENGSDLRQAVRNDPRVTPIGGVLRRLSIDELPQLWNVLRGDMSLVGPRPHALAHDDFYGREISEYAFRHHVKPGITGWAQVNGHRGETRELAHMSERVRYDLWYIDNYSVWLDVSILVRTVASLFLDKDVY